MDVILFLFKAITKLALALTGAVVAVVVFAVGKLTGHLATRARQPAPQQEPQPAAPSRQPTPAPMSSTAPPAVHVHVHLDQIHPQPAPPPAPMPTSADTSGNHPPATVLTRPDHRIYVTTGSHLMMEHPLCDDLLDRLDEILYRAAFRDGDPFMVAPPLDESRNGRAVPLELPPLAAVDEEEFFNGERQPLPPPDAALWVRRIGALQPLA